MERRPRQDSEAKRLGGRPQGRGEEFGFSSSSSSSSDGGREARCLGARGRRQSRSWADVRSLGEAEAETGSSALEEEEEEEGMPAACHGARPGSERLRKAKSMEVMSVRWGPVPQAVPAEPRGGFGPQAAGLTEAREQMVRQRVKFSRFLDEITTRVLSPATLSALSQRPVPTDKPDGRQQQVDEAYAGRPRTVAPEPGTGPNKPVEQQGEQPEPHRCHPHRNPRGPDSRLLIDSDSSPEASLMLEGEATPRSDSQHMSQELLTDPLQPKVLREENKDRHPCPACASSRVEEKDWEFGSGDGYQDSELSRAQVEHDDLGEMFCRLQHHLSRAQQGNRAMEKQLKQMVSDMEEERTSFNKRISDLTHRLSSTEKTICGLQRVTERVLRPRLCCGEARPQPTAFLDIDNSNQSVAEWETVGPAEFGPTAPEIWANRQQQEEEEEDEGPLVSEAPRPDWGLYTEAPDWPSTTQEQGPSVPGSLELTPDDPFGPLVPEGEPTVAGGKGRWEATSDGRQRCPSPRLWASVRDPWVRPEAAVGRWAQGGSRAEPGLPSLPGDRVTAWQSGKTGRAMRRAQQWVGEQPADDGDGEADVQEPQWQGRGWSGVDGVVTAAPTQRPGLAWLPPQPQDRDRRESKPPKAQCREGWSKGGPS
ncbi:uncharacterized protein [Hemitrygon akajei]|uniref:uncharacterized protein n=1 Tax=Hemitrygon akajei TaxID=2704970 RepID=UPI003BF94E4A